ncbi:ECF-type sigma factor [Acanthopleuribacter pedis]|uniref:RNA polymerase sigma-70 ECF-like HTH domain-containing protein n=1 Tax=Acanthopleuribacter pedis TaxID=442870 RepID=A0A8J7QHF4_9BACT|nr:ECF-type sigma factor [Acanthopleuribacter pedis]MBO1320255.1 hypothetical protein [Acanthopleuribacter pedis]
MSALSAGVIAEQELRSLAPNEAVVLCQRWARGDVAALETMYDQVYDDLMVIAVRKLENERRLSHFSPACLLSETFIRFRRQRPFYFASRAHFCNIAARQMSQVMIDQVREYLAAKRGGPERDEMCSLYEEIYSFGEAGRVVDSLHLALRELARLEPRQAHIVRLRFFCGCTIEEAAAEMDISISTLKRSWSDARAWLVRQVGHGG